MKKKSTIFVMLFSIAFCAPILAEEKQSNQSQPAQYQSGQSQMIKGVIEKIDREKKILTIKDEISHQTQECDYLKSSTFSKDGKKIAATDVKKGDRVSLSVDSQNIATTIKIETVATTTASQQ